jgi:hypothetical protein
MPEQLLENVLNAQTYSSGLVHSNVRAIRKRHLTLKIKFLFTITISTAPKHSLMYSTKQTATHRHSITSLLRISSKTPIHIRVSLNES